MTKPIHIVWLTRDKKGGSTMRKIWQLSAKETPPMSQEWWREEFNNTDEIILTYSYSLPFKCRLNARVKYFQYQIYHRSLITNKKLFQFNLIDHEKCDKCDETETIQHLLVECESIKKLWEDVIKWIKLRVRRKIYSEAVSIILGKEEN